MKSETLHKKPIGNTQGVNLYEEYSGDDIIITIGDTEVELSLENCSNYIFASTREGRIIFGCPKANNDQGYIYISKYSAQQFSGMQGLTVTSDLFAINTTRPDNTSDFDSLVGNQAGDNFGQFIATGDFDGDGQDDIIVGAPGGGEYGLIYVYNLNLDLTSMIFGSASYPIHSILMSNYLATDTEDLFMGPSNEAMNQGLHMG